MDGASAIIQAARLIGKGKVRDIYEIPEGVILVATDRISAFDVVFPSLIPDKGRVLSLISAFWFELVSGEIGSHFITVDPDEFPASVRDDVRALEGRAMLVRPAEILPVECVVRGYLTGSAWAEYSRVGTIGGYPMPGGLRDGDELPQPLFTPTTKETAGHDRPLGPGELEAMLGAGLAGRLAEKSRRLYLLGANYARSRGIILADSKFEFGLDGEELLLADELFTPDSSRFWPRDSYRPGHAVPSFDKQFVRDYVEQLGWDKNPPAPELPEDVIHKTREKYLEAYFRLTGRELAG